MVDPGGGSGSGCHSGGLLCSSVFSPVQREQAALATADLLLPRAARELYADPQTGSSSLIEEDGPVSQGSATPSPSPTPTPAPTPTPTPKPGAKATPSPRPRWAAAPR